MLGLRDQCTHPVRVCYDQEHYRRSFYGVRSVHNCEYHNTRLTAASTTMLGLRDQCTHPVRVCYDPTTQPFLFNSPYLINHYFQFGPPQFTSLVYSSLHLSRLNPSPIPDSINPIIYLVYLTHYVTYQFVFSIHPGYHSSHSPFSPSLGSATDTNTKYQSIINTYTSTTT